MKYINKPVQTPDILLPDYINRYKAISLDVEHSPQCCCPFSFWNSFDRCCQFFKRLHTRQRAYSPVLFVVI